MNHLRFSQCGLVEQIDIASGVLSETDWMRESLELLQDMNLSDGWITAGAIYNLVWNKLTDRSSNYGIKDIDIAYYDGDMSWEAEDKVIQRGHVKFANSIKPVEIRNEARVHLWFPKHFGFEIDPLKNSREGIERYSAKIHCVAARLQQDGDIEILAPYGLSDLFSFEFKPNKFYAENEATYQKKAIRAKAMWPELQIYDWGS